MRLPIPPRPQASPFQTPTKGRQAIFLMALNLDPKPALAAGRRAQNRHSAQIDGVAAVVEPAATLASEGQSTDSNLIKIAGTISQRLSFGRKLLESRTWQSLTQDKGRLLPTPYGN
ncbi:hypothetical protein MES4922_310014 [Mesorhizobium ventifaucium]|uniref:Uncharacterized protein n=1 Tax=Mesorhizobium ventifaucium TaxID=666020 RepID=A0ABM9E3F3_9HYPH|nr:hypothetical protein MES4922_310014 [Mesorhizobium ventifaucium]